MSLIRILVVDDYKHFRNLIRLLLQVRPEWQVICEATDGSEAVQKAQELNPHLILLDIGLPTLNGIEAARRIRQISPDSKIIFLTMDNSPDVVQAALSTGAQGYVLKADAQRDLLSAVEAVLEGKQFVSSSLAGWEATESTAAQGPHRHDILLYSDEAALAENLAIFIAAALKDGNPAIVFATESHRNGLHQRLNEQGVDVAAVIRKGTYISLDAADTLSIFMVDDWPDAVRFHKAFSGLIEAVSKEAKAEHPRVAIFGEGVALLWANGKRDATIRLEQLGNELAKTHDVDILCAYPISFHGGEDRQPFKAICAEHSAVLFR